MRIHGVCQRSAMSRETQARPCRFDRHDRSSRRGQESTWWWWGGALCDLVRGVRIVCTALGGVQQVLQCR